MSISPRLFNLLIICRRFSHLRSAYGNVIKYVGIPNCLTIASTSHKNCFQYAGVPLTELINENALSLATNFLIASVPGLFLCIAKFIDERRWCYSYTDLGKTIKFASDGKSWLKFNNLWLKYRAGLIEISQGAL